jgi:molybdopterin molybdotransferase
MPVEEALARVVAGVRPLPAETVPLAKALGRVLARDVAARRDQPPFPASAMDGYAVRHDDIAKVPTELTVIGTSAAGHGFRGTVKTREAVRISTGAPVPVGADTIVIQENTASSLTTVTVNVAPKPGQHIRAKGLDFRRGEILLRAGKFLNARDLGIAAAMNFAGLAVRRKPRVALFSTGDELVRPGVRPRADQIISSNSAALCAFVERFGGEVKDLGIVRDTIAATMQAIARASDFDILVTSGGASVGNRDYVHEALSSSGVKIGFYKIAIRPGKPLMFGCKGRQRILGLPGNPVSALVCARLFLKPLLDACLGLSPTHEFVSARLGASMPENDTRQDYVRARIARGTDGILIATPFDRQDSSMQRTLAEAGALILRKPHAPAAAEGDWVEVLLVDF